MDINELAKHKRSSLRINNLHSDPFGMSKLQKQHDKKNLQWDQKIEEHTIEPENKEKLDELKYFY